MAKSCPEISSSEVAAALMGVDCKLNGVVEGAYERLFVAGGAFQSLLTAVLTIYVAFIAYGFLFGRLSMSVSAIAPKLIALAMVLTFATSWPAYQRIVFDVMTSGPDEIVSVFSGRHADGTQAFASRIDLTLREIEAAANTVNPSVAAPEEVQIAAAMVSPQVRAASMIRTAGFLLLLGTLGVLLVARILLIVMLALGPVFALLALFSATRGFFEGWLKTTLAFALTPLVTVLGGSVGLMMIEPLVATINRDPAAAIASMQPAGALMLASLVNLALLAAGMKAAVSITSGWQLPKSGPLPTPQSGSPDPASAVSAVTGSGPVHPSSADDRVGAIISAVLRESTLGPASVQSASGVDPRISYLSLPTPTHLARPDRAGLGLSVRAKSAALLSASNPASKRP